MNRQTNDSLYRPMNISIIKCSSIGILLFIVVLTSCSVKRYEKPTVTDADQLIRNSAQHDSTYDVAAISWREFYKDPQLVQLIEAGLESNINLQIAMRRIEQAEAYVTQSKAAFFPTLNAYAQGGANNGLIGGTWDGKGVLSFGLSSSWELDVWGKLRSAKRAQVTVLLAQANNRTAIQTALIANLATAYYTLISLDVQRQVIIDQISAREDYLNTVRALKESAKVNEVAVLQAEAQLQVAKAYLPEIAMGIQMTENSICLLLGEPSRAIDRSPHKTLSELQFPEENTGLSALLLKNRPDVRAAELGVESHFQQVNVARAAMYPALTITGNISTDASTFNNWFRMPESIVWSAIGGLTQPIFNGLKLRTQKKVAQKEFEIAVLDYRNTILNAGMEVSNALLKTRMTKEKATYQMVQLRALEKAYDFSLDLLKSAYGTYLDVLNAQQGVLNAQLSLIECYKDNINARVELFRALGGGGF